MRNGVQLITYADRFGGRTLTALRELLNGPLAGVFTGVHVLPFFTPFDGADAGFDPIDHATVDPRLGSWEDIRAISQTHDVMADLIVNHASDRSHQFLDFQKRGDASAFAGMFLERRTVFPDGASNEDLRAIYRPRPRNPFTQVVMADGSLRTMWTTFTPHQIDLDINNQQTRIYLDDVLDQFAAGGVNQVRLDAVGYAVKTPGTSCFMTRDTYEFIDQIKRSVASRAMISLLEVHAHHEEQIAVAERVDRVYDFALPPLILHALHTGSTEPLVRWLTVSPRNAYTVLDTHDGIGIIDVGPDGDRTGLLSPDQIRQLVGSIDAATAGESTLATGGSASNLDLYQVNSTFFSALGCDEDRYLLARLIQFLSPGIPQVYYAGLLASRNDMALLADTGAGRDINRPFFTLGEIQSALEQPVVRRLIALARFRNTHPAFSGTFHIRPSDDHELRIRWITDDARIDAVLDITTCTFELELVRGRARTTISSWDGFISVR
jgi:sucrose phosphorylase